MATAALPPSIQDRAERYRSRLTAADVELVDLERTDDVAETTTTVLMVGRLPSERAALQGTLRRLRANLPDGVTLRIVDEERPLRSESAVVRAVQRARRSSDAAERSSIVEALRATGWTIASVERLHADDDASRLFVDLTAVDLSTITADSGEGDRDQRGE